MPELNPAAHDLTLTRSGRRVRALYQGHLIADTGAAVITHETGMPDAVYFPREDVEMEVMTPTGVQTTCSKGKITWFTILRDGVFAENGAGSLETTTDHATELANMITFDPSVVTLEVYGDETDAMWGRQQREMSDYIRHTDSGSGLSQAEHWKPNVARPDDAERDADLSAPPGGLP